MIDTFSVPNETGGVVLLDESLQVGQHLDPRPNPVHVILIPETSTQKKHYVSVDKCREK